ncbi:hypothetical protein KCU92_g104, partial [Aureobasidium melanogenum]
MTLRLSTMPLNITTGGRTDCCPTRLLDETVVEALCSIPCQMTHAVEGMKQKRPRCWQKTGPNRDKARRGRQGQKDRRSPNAESTSIFALSLRYLECVRTASRGRNRNHCPRVSPARLVVNAIVRVGDDVSESAICQIGLTMFCCPLLWNETLDDGQSCFDIDHICDSAKAFPTQRWNKNFYCKTRIALEFHDFGSLLIVLDTKHYDLQTFELYVDPRTLTIQPNAVMTYEHLFCYTHLEQKRLPQLHSCWIDPRDEQDVIQGWTQTMRLYGTSSVDTYMTQASATGLYLPLVRSVETLFTSIYKATLDD